MEKQAIEIRAPVGPTASFQQSLDGLASDIDALDPSTPEATQSAGGLQKQLIAAQKLLTIKQQDADTPSIAGIEKAKQTLTDQDRLLRLESQRKKNAKASAFISEGEAALARIETLLARLTQQAKEIESISRGLQSRLAELQSNLDDKTKGIERAKQQKESWRVVPVKLTISADSALAERLMGPLAESFAKDHWSGADVTRKKLDDKQEWRVVVANGGTSLSLAIVAESDGNLFGSLASKLIDIVVGTCEPTAAEIDKMSPLGDMKSPPCAQVIALDGLALLLHPSMSDNTAFTPAEVLLLLAGQKIRGVSSVIVPHPQGKDGNVLCRLPAEASAGVIVSPANTSVFDSVIATPGSVGFAAYSVAPTAKVAAIQADPRAPALKPSPLTIATENYKYSQRIIAYRAMKPSSELVHEFVSYIISVKGQTEVGRLGFVDQNLKAVSAPIQNEMLVKFAKALGVEEVKNAKRLPADFRFATGKATLDLKGAADIDRLVRTLAEPELRGKSIVLAGFADKRGGDVINEPLSDDRAEYIQTQLQRRWRKGDEKPLVYVGFSSMYPIDTNDTEEGFKRNRRVEVWVVDVPR